MARIYKYYLLQFVIVVLLVAMLPKLHHAYTQKSKLEHEVHDIKRDISRMEAEIYGIHNKEAKLNNSFSVWKELSHAHVYANDNRLHSENLVERIADLCKTHKVSIKNITASEPTDISDSYDKRYIRVVSSRVNVEFEAETDKNAILLMHSIKYDISGFIAVRLFEVVKNEGAIVGHHRKEQAFASGKIEFDLYMIFGQYI